MVKGGLKEPTTPPPFTNKTAIINLGHLNPILQTKLTVGSHVQVETEWECSNACVQLSPLKTMEDIHACKHTQPTFHLVSACMLLLPAGVRVKSTLFS